MTKIDAFAHILPPSYAERLEAITAGPVSDRIIGYRPWIREDPALIDLDARWRTIDPFGDYRQVLTLAVPPLEELGEPPVALELARAANDELAALVARFPDRFAGFTAALPMGDPQAAAAELDRAMTQLGAVGAQVHTNVAGAPLDEPRFEVIFDVVTKNGGALWMHPTRSPVWSDYPAERASKYGIWWSLGWPYETSVAMARLVYSGCFDRHPDLTVITHHAGAMVPHFAGRLASPLEDPDRDSIMASLKRDPMDYFRRLLRRHRDVRREQRGPLRGRVLRRRSRAIRNRHAARRPERRRRHDRRYHLARPARGRRGRHFRRERDEAARARAAG